MAPSRAERRSVSSRWWSAELMDALSKAPDKEPAARPQSEILGEDETEQLPNNQTTPTNCCDPSAVRP